MALYTNEDLMGDCNGNGRDLGLLRCVLCAALYPNVTQIKRNDFRSYGSTKKKHDRYTTRTEEVYIHPGSVNWEQGSLSKKDNWLMYNEKQMTSKMYMYDTNVVTPYSLFLFGNNLTFNYVENVIQVDEWIEFTSTAETYTIFKRLRDELNRIWMEKIQNPYGDKIEMESNIVVDAISTLLNFERNLECNLMDVGEIQIEMLKNHHRSSSGNGNGGGNGGGNRRHGNGSETKSGGGGGGICNNFTNGNCRFGKRCKFKHVGGGEINFDKI